MKRFCHYIKRNRQSEMPSNILFVDTEASIEDKPGGIQHQTFRLGYAIHAKSKDSGWTKTGYELRSVNEFWELLDRIAYDGTRLYVFAHNMKYDFTILKGDTYISSRKLKLKVDVRENVFIVRAGNICFLSSTNFYKAKLEELGNIFGLSKMESPDFRSATDNELMPYCQRDTEVLALIIEKHIEFLRNNDLGNFKPTLAGQSLGAYRHRFMHTNLLVHDYEEILALEGLSYRGGRCEAFRLGTFEDIYDLDINSMYPFVMKSLEYPTKVLQTKPLTVQTVFDLQDALDAGHYVLADCDIHLNEPLIACKREKLFFPIGDIRQVLTSPEIEHILANPECGEIVKVHSLVTYEKANIFSEFIDFFYDFRKSTDNSAYKLMAKLLMNSLYGKLGQRSFGTSVLIEDEKEYDMTLEMMRDAHTSEIWIDTGKKYVLRGTDLFLCTKTEGEYAPDSIPIIASTVTAHARMLLWELMKIAGRENVVYCDTDSLFVNRTGYDNLKDWISPTELGKLKLEKQGIVEIRGAKDYTFNGEVKRKGIKKNAQLLPDGSFRQYQFETGSTRYRKGTPDGIVVVRPVDKIVSGRYDKGIIDENGQIAPFVYSEFDRATV